MKVFLHHIYEYKKGLRHLVLYTTRKTEEQLVCRKLDRFGIDYVIYDIGLGKINVFFGDRACVDVVRSFGKHNVADYSDEEDFMIGTMLGYDRLAQCERYLRRKQRSRRPISGPPLVA